MIERVFAIVNHPPPVTVTARSAATVADVWRLMADPAAWPRWAPHILGTDTDAPGTVRPGQRIRVRGPGPVAVDTTVTRVEPGTAWDFRVGLRGPLTVTSRHRVTPRGRGSHIEVTMVLEGSGAGAVWPGLAAYRVLASRAVRRLARLAERAG